MKSELARLLDDYARWVRDKSVLRELKNDYVEITTPYLDRHNDYIQIYVRQMEGGFLLTDGGETIADLRASGCDLDTDKRKRLLTMTLNGFGIQRSDDELRVKATVENFALRKHNLIQAVLGVNDLFYLARSMVSSLFLEDVADWLHQNDIRYTPSVKFSGSSGYDHTFDFVIPASRRAPERLIRAVNRPTRDIAESMTYAWIDTKIVRPADSQFYAILNDKERATPSTLIDALRSYDLIPVLWSKRETVREKLAA